MTGRKGKKTLLEAAESAGGAMERKRTKLNMKTDARESKLVMRPRTGSDSALDAPNPVRFGEGHVSAGESLAVIQGVSTAHERDDDVHARMLATLGDLQLRMGQMEVFKLAALRIRPHDGCD
ncbi:unnamed protein product [Albugo candida]|uniref:Uncharacterized protein n=1 Tax=Albugo candida TaxID=65357 RepID=A0A024FSZ3_9STRA|nr:unnamed protein product [Albugo candida]|eukprot:CCI10190.1 unnamed protein product [Albugo candida]